MAEETQGIIESPQESISTVGVFLDLQNLLGSIRALSTPEQAFRLDFVRLLNLVRSKISEKLPQNRYAMKYAYDSAPPTEGLERNLVKGLNFQIKIIESDGNGRKNLVDRAINKDIEELKDKLDVIVLASGDGSHISILDSVLETGKQVIVVATSQNLHKQYREKPYTIVELDDPTIREAVRVSPPSLRQPNRYVRFTLNLTGSAAAAQGVIDELYSMVKRLRDIEGIYFLKHSLNDEEQERTQRERS